MTYEELQNSIKQYLEEDSTEFNTALPTVIKQAEENVYFRMEGQLPCYEKNASARLSPALAQFSFDFPGGILAIDTITCSQTVQQGNAPTVQDRCTPLEKRTESYINEIYPTRITRGDSEDREPRFYFTRGYTVYPAPLYQDSGGMGRTYTFFIDGRGFEPHLSETNATNWVSTNAENLLLQACLMEASQFLRKDPSPYRERFEEAVVGLGGHSMRVKKDHNKMPRREPSEYV